MLSHVEIAERHVVFVNAIEHKSFRVVNWNIQIEDSNTGKVLTRLYYNRVFAVFVLGHASITTAVIDKLNRYSIPLVVMKPNFKVVFFHTLAAEANFLLREQQYTHENLFVIAHHIIANKIHNQLALLRKIRSKGATLKTTIAHCDHIEHRLASCTTTEALMGIEGQTAKLFFGAYFWEFGWQSRKPRTKNDHLNTILDIGYNFLFNFVEAHVRLFGFDPYKGVCHKQWFNRKSLICDLVEPFRCIIDSKIRKALRLRQFKKEDFLLRNNMYILKKEKNKLYSTVFFDVLIKHKHDIFIYVRDYYRCFMGRKSVDRYPEFRLK